MAVVRRLQCCSDAFLPQGLSEWFHQASAACVSLDPGDDLRGKNVSDACQVELKAQRMNVVAPGAYLAEVCFPPIGGITFLHIAILSLLVHLRIPHHSP